MSMRARLVIAIVLAGGMAAVSAAFARIPPCPGGRFLVNGDPLLDADGGPTVDAIQINGKMLSTASGCGPVKAKMRGTKVGTRVSVKFKTCTGLVAKSVVKGLITDGCATLNGTFAVPALLVLKPFLATLSMCGDGIWDPDGGEECDGALGPCGGLCTACTCGGATTTTTSVTTTTGGTGSTATTTTTSGGSTSTGGATTTTSGGTTSTGGATTTTSGGTTSTGGTTTTSGGTTTTSGGTTTTSAASTTSTSTAAPTTTTKSTTTTTHTTTSTTAGGGPTTTSTSTSSMPVFSTTTATTSTTLAGPDLVPIMFACPNAAPARAGIAVDFGVKNYGTATAVAPWWEYVLWSTDQTFGGDTAIFGYQRVSNLAAGAQYTPVTQTVNVPNVAAGTYYLWFQTDGANAVAEGNDLNNIIGPVAITVANADLTPTVLTPPASANAGATIQIAYSVKNQGNTSAIGPWNDTLYLSTDMAFGGDMVLGTFGESIAGTGGTYNRNQTVIIPNVTPGTYYVFLETETGNQLYESNENNNRKGPVAITIN